jgi:hypothetical protein
MLCVQLYHYLPALYVLWNGLFDSTLTFSAAIMSLLQGPIFRPMRRSASSWYARPPYSQTLSLRVFLIYSTFDYWDSACRCFVGKWYGSVFDSNWKTVVAAFVYYRFATRHSFHYLACANYVLSWDWQKIETCLLRLLLDSHHDLSLFVVYHHELFFWA